ncbi:hypothetical protein RYX36_019247 [Vicia faba]
MKHNTRTKNLKEEPPENESNTVDRRTRNAVKAPFCKNDGSTTRDLPTHIRRGAPIKSRRPPTSRISLLPPSNPQQFQPSPPFLPHPRRLGPVCSSVVFRACLLRYNSPAAGLISVSRLGWNTRRNRYRHMPFTVLAPTVEENQQEEARNEQ